MHIHGAATNRHGEMWHMRDEAAAQIKAEDKFRTAVMAASIVIRRFMKESSHHLKYRERNRAAVK